MGGQSPISSREVKKFETNQQCSVLTVEFISTVVVLLVSVFKVSSTNFANMWCEIKGSYRLYLTYITEQSVFTKSW